MWQCEYVLVWPKQCATEAGVIMRELKVFDWLWHGLNPTSAFGWSMQHSFEAKQSSVSPPQRGLEPQLLPELRQSVTLTQLHRQTSTFSHNEGHHPSPSAELPLC